MSIASTVPLADTWGMHGDVGAGWMILMLVVMVLFWAAMERRFAEGAMSIEEFRQRRELLGNGASGAEKAGIQGERLTASATTKQRSES